MRKRNVRAAIAAALCMTVLAAGCGKKADDPVFTGDKTEAPIYQANWMQLNLLHMHRQTIWIWNLELIFL
ncbi:MAG: hypothetical protein ACLU00_01645 [Mediterraneibacter faecis]